MTKKTRNRMLYSVRTFEFFPRSCKARSIGRRTPERGKRFTNFPNFSRKEKQPYEYQNRQQIWQGEPEDKNQERRRPQAAFFHDGFDHEIRPVSNVSRRAKKYPP